MESQSTEAINWQLRVHQADVQDWDFNRLAADLHLWAERMILEFKLEIGTPALRIDSLRRPGHYRPGRNAFGLKDEIAIDEGHARGSLYWQLLGTLLHEILHSWQEHNGKAPSPNSHNYHNKEYREKAASLGLIVDERGYTQYAPGTTPFFNLLKKYGIEVPEVPRPKLVPLRVSRTKLKLWECPCGVKVRVGRSRFNAKCLDCGGLFERRD